LSSFAPTRLLPDVYRLGSGEVHGYLGQAYVKHITRITLDNLYQYAGQKAQRQ
jgi:hypothetical protein